MSENNQSKFWLYVVVGLGALLFVASGVALIAAVFYRNVMLSKFLAVMIIAEIVACIIGIPIAQSQLKNPSGDNKTEEEDKWLLRLVLVTALGMCIVVIYAVQWMDIEAIIIAGVGLLAAGAAWLIAALIGFLFGIPHREHSSSVNVEQKPDDKAKGGSTPGQEKKEIDIQDPVSSNQGPLYQGSTSLEQVSDWLTKIIVGVGLTQLNKIPGKLDGLATYIATGMGTNAGTNASSHRVFALAICIYFGSCGFLFGYLWARLYMLKAFERAETREKERIAERLALARLRV
jgi:hypothetical protein